MKKFSKSFMAIAMAIATVAGTCPIASVAQIPQAVAVSTTEEETPFANKTFENPFTVEKALEAFNVNGNYDEYISHAMVYQNETADIYYVINVETGDATIVGMKAKTADVVIPEFISDKIGVFEILSLWNPETKLPDSNVKSIKIECTEDYRTSIQLIDSYSFSGFENLESIEFSSVAIRTKDLTADQEHYLTVNKYAFDGCYNLEKMVLPAIMTFETTANQEDWADYSDSSKYNPYDQEPERYTSSKKGIKLVLVGKTISDKDMPVPTIAKDMIQLTDVTFSAGRCQKEFSKAIKSHQGLTLVDIENKINIVDDITTAPIIRVVGCNIGELEFHGYNLNRYTKTDRISMLSHCTIDKITLKHYASGMLDDFQVHYSDIKEVYFADRAITQATELFSNCDIDKVSIKSRAADHFVLLKDTGVVDNTDQDYIPWIEKLKNLSEKDWLSIKGDDIYPFLHSGTLKHHKGYFYCCNINDMQFRDGTDFIPSVFAHNSSIINLQLPDRAEDLVISQYAFCSSDSNGIVECNTEALKTPKINIRIPDGTVFIANEAFTCFNIDTLFIPESVIYCKNQKLIASNVVYEGKNTKVDDSIKFYNKEMRYPEPTIYGCTNDAVVGNGYTYPQKLCKEKDLKFVELHSGDINSDSELTIADAVQMQRYLLGIDKISTAECLTGDLTGDNTVDVFDMILLRQKLVKELGL